VSYIESNVEKGTYIFKLSELHDMYEAQLIVVGVLKTINTTRFKYLLLGTFSSPCQEQSDGKRVLLVFKEGLNKLFREATESRYYESEALSMAILVKAIRKDSKLQSNQRNGKLACISCLQSKDWFAQQIYGNGCYVEGTGQH
jgi:hypothetical protein